MIVKNGKNKYKHQRMRLCKLKAKELMLSGENHLLLIFSLMILGATAIILQLIFSMIYAFFPYLMVDVALYVMTFLIEAPLVYGILRVVWRGADGEKCTIADIFEAFYTIGEWWRAILIFIIILIIAAAEIFLLAIPLSASEWMAELSISVKLADSLGVVGFFAVLFGLALLNCRMSLFPMIAVKGLGVFKAIRCSFSLTKGRTFRLWGYHLGFVPLLIVSALAVLVPMLIYTAPYMLCVYAIGVKMMCENNNE